MRPPRPPSRRDKAYQDKDSQSFHLRDNARAGKVTATVRRVLGRAMGGVFSIGKTVCAAAAALLLALAPTAAETPQKAVKIGLVDYAVDHRAFEDLPNVVVKSITFQSTGYRPARFQSQANQRAHGDVMTRALLAAFRQLKPDTPVEVYVATPFMTADDKRVVLDPEQLAFAYDWFAFQGVRIVAQTFVGADSEGLRAASKRAASHGLIILASAGNGPGENAVPPYPASYAGAIGISTTALVSALAAEPQRNTYVEYSVAALEISVLRLRRDPELSSLLGSSYATAAAAGLLGALSTRCHIGTPDDARAVLDTFAVPLDETPNGRAYGRGVLVPEVITRRLDGGATVPNGVICGPTVA